MKEGNGGEEESSRRRIRRITVVLAGVPALCLAMSAKSGVSASPLSPSLSLSFAPRSSLSLRTSSRTSSSRLCSLLSLRGGASDDDASDDDDDDDDSDIESETESEMESEIESEDDSKASSASTQPVKIKLRTCLVPPSSSAAASSIIDQSIEITASPTRTVSSLKQSVHRQFRGRPPIPSIRLSLPHHHHDSLPDDWLVEDLIHQIDQDDEDDDDEDGNDEDQDEDDLETITIQVDIIPPVDPKFGTNELGRDRIDAYSTSDLLDAYAANLAALHFNSRQLYQHSQPTTVHHRHHDDDDDDDDDITDDTHINNEMHNYKDEMVSMRKQALTIKDQLIQSFTEEVRNKLQMPSPEQLAQMEERHGNVQEKGMLADAMDRDLMLKESIKRKKKTRGGAKMNVKRTLQRNLNIVSFFTLLFC